MRRASQRLQTVQYRYSEQDSCLASGWSQRTVRGSQSVVHRVAILTSHIRRGMGPKRIYNSVTEGRHVSYQEPTIISQLGRGIVKASIVSIASCGQDIGRGDFTSSLCTHRFNGAYEVKGMIRSGIVLGRRPEKLRLKLFRGSGR